MTMATPSDFSPYPWMKFAFQEFGQRGIPGKHHNPRVLLYHSAAGGATTDETPWCCAFANWCMKQAGIHGTARANARSWLTWGQQCMAAPAFGAVTVFSRPPAAWQGHVAFYVGKIAGKIIVLGGNQGNSVCIKGYPATRLLGYRWPQGFPLPATGGSGAVASVAGLAAAMSLA